MVQVTPRCRINPRPYVDARGYYWPCCWIANEPHVAKAREFLGDDIAQFDTKTYSTADIEQSQAMRTLEGSWPEGTLEPCVVFCGKTYEDGEPVQRDTHILIDLETFETMKW